MTGSGGVVSMMNALPGSIAAAFRSGGLGARLLRPLVNCLIADQPTPVVVRSGPAQGLRLLIDPIREKYYWTGTHETAVQEAMSAFLRPGMAFWDVGAHIGFLTLLGSRLVGATGQVHAFEPAPENLERLAASIGMNDLQNVTVHGVALAASGGEAVLYSDTSSSTWTLVRPCGEAEAIPVRCRTLDEMAGPARPPDLIKIDAEEAEVDVLRGGLSLLATAHPRLIVEFSSGELVAEARRLLPSYTFQQVADRHWVLL